MCDLRCGSSEEDPQGFCQIWTHEHIRTQGFDEHTYQRGYMDPVLYGRLIQQCADIGVSSIKLNYRGRALAAPAHRLLRPRGGRPGLPRHHDEHQRQRRRAQEARAVRADGGGRHHGPDVLGGRLRPRDLPPPARGRELGDPAQLRALRGARAGRGQGRPRLPHPRLGRAHAPERGARGQRADGGVLEGEDGGRLDVDQRVLLPRRAAAPLEGGPLAADVGGRVPVLGPLPPHGGDLGRPAHHALLPGLHARDRRRPGGARAELPAHEEPQGGLGQRQLRPAARARTASAPGTTPSRASPSASPAR